MMTTMTAAQAELAEKYYHLVDEFLRRRGHQDDVDAYDAALNAFPLAVQAYDGNAELQESYGFPAVAVRRMNNRLLDHLAKKRKQNEAVRIVSFDEPVKGASSRPLQDILDVRQPDMADTVQNRLLIHSILASLTRKQADALTLQAQGHSYKEMAELCGISPYGIGSRLSRMRKKARKVRVQVEVGS